MRWIEYWLFSTNLLVFNKAVCDHSSNLMRLITKIWEKYKHEIQRLHDTAYVEERTFDLGKSTKVKVKKVIIENIDEAWRSGKEIVYQTMQSRERRKGFKV